MQAITWYVIREAGSLFFHRYLPSVSIVQSLNLEVIGVTETLPGQPIPALEIMEAFDSTPLEVA